MAVVYALFVLEDTEDEQKEVAEAQTEKRAPIVDEQSLLRRFREFLIDLSNPQLIMDCIKMLSQKSEGGKGRGMMLFLFLTGVVIHGAYGTEIYSNNTKYARIKFNWDATYISIFTSFVSLSYFIGTLLITSILGKALKISDLMLSIIGCTLNCISQFAQVRSN